jgi:hypothetical protein
MPGFITRAFLFNSYFINNYQFAFFLILASIGFRQAFNLINFVAK